MGLKASVWVTPGQQQIQAGTYSGGTRVVVDYTGTTSSDDIYNIKVRGHQFLDVKKIASYTHILLYGPYVNKLQTDSS